MPRNAFLPMEVIFLDLTVILFKFLHPSNAREEILAAPLPIVSFFKEVHLEKQAFPMVLTEFFIFTVFKFLHWENADFPMAVMQNSASFIRTVCFTVREVRDAFFFVVPMRVTVPFPFVPAFVILYFMPFMV